MEILGRGSLHATRAASASPSSSAVETKLPALITQASQPNCGYPPCHMSRAKRASLPGGDREASFSPSFWRQLLFKKAWATQSREEPELRPEEVPTNGEQRDKAMLLDPSSIPADPNVADPGFSDFQKVLAAPVEHIKDSWNQVSEMSRQQGETTRRRVLGTPMFMSLACMFGGVTREGSAHALVRAIIDTSKAPSKPFDATDERLRDAAVTFEKALNAPTVVEEEQLWTLVIEKYGSLEAEWVSDIVSRAYGNRGNARSRQGKLEQALEDYDKSIMLAPYAVDPVLNRGVVLESLGRYDEASADYVAVLRAQPNDPAAWNNLGNVKAAQNRWDDALIGFAKAVELAPVFSFAAANYALALYQVGRVNEAVKQFRSLLRKYPEFPDMRAALAVSLYAEGLTAEAESNWVRLEDGRYKDRSWVRNTRRWPPRLVNDLEAFLDVRSSRNSAVQIF